MDVNIHYTRLSARGTTIFREGFVADNGQRLTTYSVVPEPERQRLSEGFWRDSALAPGRLLRAVRKHYYYNEYFDVLAFYDTDDELAGYYCDIVTPLQKVGAEYFLTDLFLDLWLAPGQPPMALDEDEFSSAVGQGLLSAEQIERARATFTRLREESSAGIFPHRYIEA
jgi:predicted RNA-binding protein associated with RNAse of E/G family